MQKLKRTLIILTLVIMPVVIFDCDALDLFLNGIL
jgi:hypothetical protein